LILAVSRDRVAEVGIRWVVSSGEAASLLDTISVPLAQADQGHVDEWLRAGATTRHALRPFLIWARARGLAGDVEVPSVPVGTPKSRHGAQEQWQQLHACIHDSTLPTDVRVAGGLLLLFGIRITVLARLRHSQIRAGPDGTHLTVAEHELLIPPLLARPLADLVQRTGTATARTSIIGGTGDGWIFPGLRPGIHLTPEQLAARLRSHGIGIRPGATPRWPSWPPTCPPRSSPTWSASASPPRSGGLGMPNETGRPTSPRGPPIGIPQREIHELPLWARHSKRSSTTAGTTSEHGCSGLQVARADTSRRHAELAPPLVSVTIYQ
jgi:hypothetical protein